MEMHGTVEVVLVGVVGVVGVNGIPSETMSIVTSHGDPPAYPLVRHFPALWLAPVVDPSNKIKTRVNVDQPPMALVIISLSHWQYRCRL